MIDTIIKLLSYSVYTTLIVIVMLFFCRLITIVNEKKNYHRFCLSDILVMLLLISVSSLRYGVGSDYYKYLKNAIIYSRFFPNLDAVFAPDNIVGYSYQIGYIAISVITYKLFDNQYAIFFVVACLIYIPYIWYFRKKTENAFIAITVYFLFGFWGLSLNIIKQALAMVFILYAYEFFKDKKYLMFCFLSVIAFFFHTTGIIAACGIIGAKFVKPTKRNLINCILIGLILKVSYMLFLRVFIRIPFFQKYIDRYLVDGSVGNTDRTLLLFGAFVETLFVIVLLYISIQNKHSLIKNQSDIASYLSIIMLGIPFSILGISRVLWLSNRFAKYYFQFILVLIPAYWESGKPKYLCPNSISFPVKGIMSKNRQQLILLSLFIYHFLYSILMLDNNTLEIHTLFSAS